MSEELKYNAMSREMLEQLPRGAFLSVKSGNEKNTMTIGWGAIGFFWQRPVLIVGVRYSRHTYSLIEKATDFSVTVPLSGNFKKELAGAGSKSGRDIDKFTVFNLQAAAGKEIDSPVIGGCGLVYECRLIFKQIMEPELLNEELLNKFYKDGDYHVMYYGEIVSCYTNN